MKKLILVIVSFLLLTSCQPVENLQFYHNVIVIDTFTRNEKYFVQLFFYDDPDQDHNYRYKQFKNSYKIIRVDKNDFSKVQDLDTLN